MENTLVLCKTKAQVREVLAKAKKIGYRVHDDYVDRFWRDYRSETVINLNSNGQSVTYSDKDWYEKHYSEKIISAIEFLGFKPILITRKGRVVTAENKNTGDQAIATCSPTDTFDFGTGAMIAVARLMAKTPEALTDDVKAEWKKVLGIKEVESYTDDDRNFKVGDKVVVRDWDDMAKEYGAEGNDIHPDECTTSFTSKMKHLCGRTATITDVDDDYVRVEFDDESGDTNWYYRRWMFNPSDSDRPTSKFNVDDLVTLKDGLESGEVYDGITLLSNMYRNGNCKPLKVVEIDSNGHYCCAPTDESIVVAVPYWYSEEMLELWDENRIYEGDIVKVINTGLNYSTYPQWVGEHISDPDMAARYCFGSPSDEGNYKVIKIAEHESNGRTLAYIEQCDGFVFNKCYLVEVKGLEKVTE